MKIQVGDMILYRKSVDWGKQAHLGLVIDLDHAVNDDWILVLWSDTGRMTWESLDDNSCHEFHSFEVIND